MSEDIVSKVLPLTAPDGTVVDCHAVAVQDEAMMASLHDNLVPGSTHVITIKTGPVIRAGDVVKVGGEEFPVLGVYDPYDNPGVEMPDEKSAEDINNPYDRQQQKELILQQKVAIKSSLDEQRGKITKILTCIK